jgi:hypothetical protein
MANCGAFYGLSDADFQVFTVLFGGVRQPH